jgi:FtsZ-binding cell division protein ZapB
VSVPTSLLVYRTELERLREENHALRSRLAEKCGAFEFLEEVNASLRRRLDDVYAERLRLILNGDANG